MTGTRKPEFHGRTASAVGPPVMPSASERAASYTLRLERLSRLWQDHSENIIEIADEIKERVDSRWALDPASTASAALNEAASRIGLDPKDLADLVTMLWRYERGK